MSCEESKGLSALGKRGAGKPVVAFLTTVVLLSGVAAGEGMADGADQEPVRVKGGLDSPFLNKNGAASSVAAWQASRLRTVELEQAGANDAEVIIRVKPDGTGDGSSWDLAMGSLVEALIFGEIFAGSGGGQTVQIWVAEGTYLAGGGGTNRNASFELFDGVELLGGFAGDEQEASQRDPQANPTILTGDLGQPGVATDNAYNVIRFQSFFETALIDGFTIRDGYADGSGDRANGGGLWVKWGNTIVRDCVFEDNYAAEQGGAMYSDGGAPKVADTTFVSNASETGGAVYISDGGEFHNCAFVGNEAAFGGGLSGCCDDVLVADCSFIDNFALNGGAVTMNGGKLEVVWSTFAQNAASNGGALRIDGGNNHLITNSSIVAGVANEGAGIFTTTNLEIVNTVIAWNDSFSRGGGVFFDGPGKQLIASHCTIYSNSALQSGGGFYLSRGDTQVFNSLAYDNTAFLGSLLDDQLDTTGLSTLEARFSCIQGVDNSGAPFLGPGNFDLPPRLESPNGPDGTPGTGDEDLRPKFDSPLVDAAEDQTIPMDPLDIDVNLVTEEPVPLDRAGGTRFVEIAEDVPAGSDLRADIGAFESTLLQGPCVGDLNGDGVIDALDLSKLLSYLSNPIIIVPGGDGGPETDTPQDDALDLPPGDINGDGVVDALDLSIMLGGFGQEC